MTIPHGTVKGFHVERVEEQEPVVLPDGTECVVTHVAVARSISWKFCAQCGWILVEGVVGALRFMATHDEHAPAITTDADLARHVAETGKCAFVGPCDSSKCQDVECADPAAEVR